MLKLIIQSFFFLCVCVSFIKKKKLGFEEDSYTSYTHRHKILMVPSVTRACLGMFKISQF